MHNKNLGYIHTNWENLRLFTDPDVARPHQRLEPWIKLNDPDTGSPSPVHLPTLTIMLDTQTQVIDYLTQAGREPTRRMPHLLEDLDDLLHLNRHSVGAWRAEVEDWAATTATLIDNHLNGKYDGQRIHAACPICTSIDSLVIRYLNVGDTVEPYLRCESGICEPAEAYCGTWVHGYPAWPMREWEWFAGLLQVQNKAA